jgi:hypothetical protein
MRPPGPIATGIATAMSLFTLWWARVPGGDGGWILLAVGTWFILAIYWLGTVAETTYHVMRGFAARAGLSPRVRGWLTLPLVGVTTIALLQLDAPLRIGFWVSRPSMERFVQQVLAGTNAAKARVGIYSASRAETVGADGVQFVTNSKPGIFSVAGFAHLPSGPPAAPASGVSYIHLHGSWYEYHWDD